MRTRKFSNIDPIKQHTSMKQFKRWRQERIRKLRSKDYSYNVPCVQPDLRYIKQNELASTVTWVGHSTFFIQLCGLNIVTDPVWANQMALRKRMTAPGIAIERVPPVDVILISHSHYDHLNIPSLRKLQGDKQLLVPAGLSAKLKLRGFTNITELHWWESITIKDVTFTFVPAQHWTRRNPWDTNSSHWGGWLMEPAKKQQHNVAEKDVHIHQAVAESPVESRDGAKQIGDQQQCEEVGCFFEQEDNSSRPRLAKEPVIYFAGDSGYFAGFKEIGDRFNIDIALLPIGAYEPEWFMGPQHVTPEEALQAFLDTKATYFVPMHYGSFKLADDTPREALERLFGEMERLRIDSSSLILLPHGETWRVTNE